MILTCKIYAIPDKSGQCLTFRKHCHNFLEKRKCAGVFLKTKNKNKQEQKVQNVLTTQMSIPYLHFQSKNYSDEDSRMLLGCKCNTLSTLWTSTKNWPTATILSTYQLWISPRTELIGLSVQRVRIRGNNWLYEK